MQDRHWGAGTASKDAIRSQHAQILKITMLEERNRTGKTCTVEGRCCRPQEWTWGGVVFNYWTPEIITSKKGPCPVSWSSLHSETAKQASQSRDKTVFIKELSSSWSQHQWGRSICCPATLEKLAVLTLISKLPVTYYSGGLKHCMFERDLGWCGPV